MSQYNELSELTKRLAQLYKETNKNFKPIIESLSSLQQIIDTNLTPLKEAFNKLYAPQINEIKNTYANTLGDLSEKFKPIWEQFDADNKLTKEQLISKYKTRFDSNVFLGEAGWVASAFGNASDYTEWVKCIKNENENKILDFFEGKFGVLNSIINDLQEYNNNRDNKIYFEKARMFFESKDYMSCAFYLLSLLNYRINTIFDFGGRRKPSAKFTYKGFEIMMKKEFQKNNESLARKYFLILDMYPSLYSFLYRLFVDDNYKFEDNIEPPYLNRNWLMHGYSRRQITRIDCIQLFNALHTIEFINDWSNVQYTNDLQS